MPWKWIPKKFQHGATNLSAFAVTHNSTLVRNLLLQSAVEDQSTMEKNSWRSYNDFLDDYGSHVVTSVMRGVRIKEMSFSRSSESYSERDFQVKSCVSFAGPTSVGKVGVSACANISKQESSKASDMSTTDKLFVRGGSKKPVISCYMTGQRK